MLGILCTSRAGQGVRDADRDGLQGANHRHSRSYGEDLQRRRPPEAADAGGAAICAEDPYPAPHCRQNCGLFSGAQQIQRHVVQAYGRVWPGHPECENGSSPAGSGNAARRGCPRRPESAAPGAQTPHSHRPLPRCTAVPGREPASAAGLASCTCCSVRCKDCCRNGAWTTGAPDHAAPKWTAHCAPAHQANQKPPAATRWSAARRPAADQRNARLR